VLSKEFIQQHRVYHFVVNALGLPIRIRATRVEFTSATSSAIRPKAGD
jgi:hypothetical protein